MKKMGISRINPNDPSNHRQKKPKFIAHQNQNPRTLDEPDYSQIHLQRQNVTTCDPKTSEFAFFKKLKKDASLRFSSGTLEKDDSLSSKKLESGDCSKDRTVDVGIATKGYNSSKIKQDVSTFKTDSFRSPSLGALNKSDIHSMSSMLENSQCCGDTSKPWGFSHEENQCEDGKIFSRKRQKLRQCVADTLFPDTEKLCSKGYDIVSILLSRLFPMITDCTVENKYEESNPQKIENATRYDLLDSRESDVQFKEHNLIPKRKLLELESGSYFNDQLLSPTFLESGERIASYAEHPTYDSQDFLPRYSTTSPQCKLSRTPSFRASVKSDITLGPLFNEVENATKYSLLDSRELDFQCTELHQMPKRKLLELESSTYFSDHLLSPMFLQSVELITPHTDFPIYPHKFQPEFRTEAQGKFDGIPSYPDKNDVSYGFLCNEQKHEPFTLDHFKELGKLEREPIPLLLGKDFDFTKDEIELPITCKYANPYMAPALSILGNGEEQISNDSLGEFHFSPSSLLHNKPHDFNSLLDSGLLSYQKSQFGKYVHNDEEQMDMNFNHTSLSLSHNKHYFKLSENCNNDTSCVQDSIYIPPYHHWIRQAISSNYHHHPDAEAWLSFSPRCLSLTSSHSNYQSSISRNLHLPESESISSLLHIGDNKYEHKIIGGDHGKVLYHFSEAFVEIYNSSLLHMSMQRDNGYPFTLDDSDNINEQEQRHEMLL